MTSLNDNAASIQTPPLTINVLSKGTPDEVSRLCRRG